jgi:hypothetical protein
MRFAEAGSEPRRFDGEVSAETGIRTNLFPSR